MSGRPRVDVSRAIRLPDSVRVARCRRAPELGPRLLFFSGGTALRPLSRQLKLLTHNSIHLITPFDSGGSSAALRDAFGMLSVGDVRNRLMALADETQRGNPEIYRLFSYRFPADAGQAALRERLQAMIGGADELIREVPRPLNRLIQTHLRVFAEHMPARFDLRGASIGNLVLAGGWLHHQRHIDSVIFLFSKLVEVRGLVRPVAHADLHLAAALEDGTRLVGQHLLTGKEVAPIASPVASLELVGGLSSPEPASAALHPDTAALIRRADLVCYPMGSFYTSLAATLLPEGVGSAVRDACCPKVYVPNTGRDPEQLGMTLSGTVERLLALLRRDAGAETPVEQLLEFVLVDPARAHYGLALDLERTRRLGVQVVELSLVSESGPPHIDALALANVLVSMAG